MEKNALALTPGLLWNPPSRDLGSVYVMKSECRRYSIHAEKATTGWRYTALVRTDVWNNVLGWTGDKGEAMALCEMHARGI
jgi:hypothetical protein